MHFCHCFLVFLSDKLYRNGREFFLFSDACLSTVLSLRQEETQETEPIEETQDGQDIDDSNMADPVRLSAPDVYKDYAVRR